jgi:23S rRNA (pseudouridine1915-N3)-methyltransferase
VWVLVGKTTENYLIESVSLYTERISHYITFETIVIPELKNVRNVAREQQKEREGVAILQLLLPSDEVILLDEKGKTYTSESFAEWIEKKMINSVKRLVFVVGGPYGFSDAVYARANHKLALSHMTFSHQLIRLLFIEQFYRAMTILKGESYHHG